MGVLQAETAGEDIDRPPAGTECCICRTMGHYCKAVRYAREDADVGICQACIDGVDCPTMEMRRPQPEALILDLDAQPISQGRVIPKEEWNAPPTPTAATPDFQETQQRDFLVRNFKDFGAYLHDAPKEDIRLIYAAAQTATKPAWFVTEKVGGRSEFVLLDTIFYSTHGAARMIAQVTSTKTPDTECSVHVWGYTTVPPVKRGRKPGSGRQASDNYKLPQRAEAAKLLESGASLRETSAATGLAKNTVMSVKRETPLAPAKANAGGAPQHKVRQQHKVPEPEDVIELAEKLKEARERVIELEALWLSFFTGKPQA